jgi:hypothetical protein
MNRRNIFKLLAGVACAAAIELTGVKPLVAAIKTKVVANPEYLTAPLEMRVYGNTAFLDRVIVPTKQPKPEGYTEVGVLPRFDQIDGKYIQIHPYIVVPA